MANRTIPVAVTAQSHTQCTSCHSTVIYTVLSDMQPHLYCSRCNNAYHQLHVGADHARIHMQHTANRTMHTIQSHAPVCECGGLFLFNAKPRCPHCNKHLDLPSPTDAKGRLRFGDLILFDQSKLFLDNGTYHLYQFEHA